MQPSKPSHASVKYVPARLQQQQTEAHAAPAALIPPQQTAAPPAVTVAHPRPGKHTQPTRGDVVIEQLSATPSTTTPASSVRDLSLGQLKSKLNDLSLKHYHKPPAYTADKLTGMWVVRVVVGGGRDVYDSVPCKTKDEATANVIQQVLNTHPFD